MTIKYYYMFSISTGSKGGDFANTELEDLFSLKMHTVWLELSWYYVGVSGYKKKEKQ